MALGPLSAEGTEEHKDRGWMIRMLLPRDTSSGVSIGSLREQCVCVCLQGVNASVVPTYAQTPVCEHAMCPHALDGVTSSTKWIPVDSHLQDRSL